MSRSMFQALADEETSRDFISRTVDRFYPVNAEYEDEDVSYRKFVGTVAEANTCNIFRYCESPIERAFFVALQSTFLMIEEGNIFFECAPKADIREAQSERRTRVEKYLQPYVFYLNLPDSARPATFKDFLRNCHGELEEEGIRILNNESLYSYDLNHHNSVHITLQPRFIDFYAPGHNIRVDAIAWVPGNPSMRLVIECDGFDYHKDRSSFTGDRRRDRKLSSLGFSVRRYSGSEIVTDLFGAVRDLHDHLKTYEIGWDYADKWRTAFQEKYRDHVTPSSEVINSWHETLRGEHK